jgi:hypothetical protein
MAHLTVMEAVFAGQPSRIFYFSDEPLHGGSHVHAIEAPVFLHTGTRTGRNTYGMLLPLILVFMIILCNGRRLLGRYVNGLARNVIAWVTTIVMTILTLLIIWTTIFALP